MCALVTGVQTCALPISVRAALPGPREFPRCRIAAAAARRHPLRCALPPPRSHGVDVVHRHWFTPATAVRPPVHAAAGDLRPAARSRRGHDPGSVDSGPGSAMTGPRTAHTFATHTPARFT